MPTTEFLKLRDIQFMEQKKKITVKNMKICVLLLVMSFISCIILEKNHLKCLSFCFLINEVDLTIMCLLILGRLYIKYN
jgi:hypothetical protein